MYPIFSGLPISFAVEDVHLVIINDELALHVSETNDQMYKMISKQIEFLVNDDDSIGDITHDSSSYFLPALDRDCEPVSSRSVSDCVEVYWPGDDVYYPSVFEEITTDDKHTVQYDDGDSETLDINGEQWRYINLLSAKVSYLPRFESEKPKVLKEILNYIGDKPFLFQHVQRFPQHVIYETYKQEEAELVKPVERYRSMMFLSIRT